MEEVAEVAEVAEVITIRTRTGVRQTMLRSIAVSQICTATPTEDATIFQLTVQEKQQVTTTRRLCTIVLGVQTHFVSLLLKLLNDGVRQD